MTQWDRGKVPCLAGVMTLSYLISDGTIPLSITFIAQGEDAHVLYVICPVMARWMGGRESSPGNSLVRHSTVNKKSYIIE